MPNFKDIIKLIGDEQGKIFVVDTEGDLKFVVMKAEEYQKLLVGKIEVVADEIEQVNREILEAQLEDFKSSPDHIAGSLKNRLAELRRDVTYPKVSTEQSTEVETIDPSFKDYL